ncbi:hypothetical protein, partial [Paraburkholderia aspalathi]
ASDIAALLAPACDHWLAQSVKTGSPAAYRQSAYAIYFLGDDHFVESQIGDHAQQFGAINASTGCLLSVSPGDIIASIRRTLLNVGLASEILFVGANAKIQASDFHEGRPR